MVLKIRKTEARQGRKGGHVFLVLVGGLFLAGLVWLGVEIYGAAIAPEEPAHSEAAKTE